MSHNYRINEIFYSLQGEGVRSGTANVFVRFSGCNLTCDVETVGFDCDTEFTSGVNMTLPDIASALAQFPCKNIIFTGGEPTLQLDEALVDALHQEDYFLAIETNGTKELDYALDWICVSPKSAEHTLRIGRHVDELKYVRNIGQGLPRPSLTADHYLISPAFVNRQLSKETLDYCMNMVKENAPWRLSLQMHNLWQVR